MRSLASIRLGAGTKAGRAKEIIKGVQKTQGGCVELFELFEPIELFELFEPIEPIEPSQQKA